MSAAAAMAFPARRWVTRLPLRPPSLGNPRRKPKGATSRPRSEAECRPARERGSLDNSNYLATSYAELLKESENKGDVYRKKARLQALLLLSIEKIVRADELRLEELKDHEPGPEVDAEIARVLAHAKRRSADYRRLQDCQTQWISFRSKCCSTYLAVPIGCNHRMCFFCNTHRAEKYRDRVRFLFDRLEHPVFLTLTIPSVGRISKRTFSAFRRAWNTMRKQHGSWISGGMIALETTYNAARSEPWHVHGHVLIDAATTLPVCKCRPRGRRGDRRHKPGCAFIRFKRSLEFDWLLLTGGRRNGWRPADRDHWLQQTERRDWTDDAARYQWNANNRRVVDVRRVTDRKKAAWEVLKYITKASEFCNDPKAVDGFITATKGTRMLQTFGSWYGFPFPDDVNGDWSHLECNCGDNDFERQGVVFREGVYMDENTGRWRVKEQVFARGPTIQKMEVA